MFLQIRRSFLRVPSEFHAAIITGEDITRLTLTLTRRGERMRDSGPVERVAGQSTALRDRKRRVKLVRFEQSPCERAVGRQVETKHTLLSEVSRVSGPWLGREH